MKITVLLEPSEEGGYTVYAPGLPGCISEGNSKDDALQNIQEAYDQVSFVHISFSAFVFDLETEAEIQPQENETLSGGQKVRQAGVFE